MPNPYFRFQKFIIRQEKCAMKVCTDACLFGAWVANRMKNAGRILDIGTGTGLLSLMVAQKSMALIDAIEIDKDACEQAGENFQNSPWANRLNIINAPVQQFATSFLYDNTSSYDLVLSNPPFHKNDLRSQDSKRNIAMHSETLGLDQLMDSANKMLMPGGFFSLIIPYRRAEYTRRLAAEKGFCLTDIVNIRQTARHTYFRTIYLFCKSSCEPAKASEIIIKNDNQTYTAEFGKLMQDYYLIPDNQSK